MKLKSGVLAAIAFISTSANASDRCRALALVSARSNGDSIPFDLRQGEILAAFGAVMRDDHTGVTRYCQEGGGCYATPTLVAGRRVPTLRLLDCTIDMAHPSHSGGQTIYMLIGHEPPNSAAPRP